MQIELGKEAQEEYEEHWRRISVSCFKKPF